MKNSLFFVILVFMYSISVHAQKYEIGLTTGIGISEGHINNKYEYEPNVHTNTRSIGLDFKFLFLREKQLSFYLGVGAGYVNNRYYYKYDDLVFGSTLGFIYFPQNFIKIPVSLGLDYNFYKKNSIGVQVHFQHNVGLNKDHLINFEGASSFLSGFKTA